jgi:hypothetical protein
MDERVAFFKLDEAASGGAIRTVATAAAPAHKAAAARPAPAAARQANGAAKPAPVKRAQVAGNTALKDDPDWKEF